MYPIIISNKYFTRRQKRYLKKHGFEWDGLNFVGYLNNDRKVRKIKYYCQNHKLKFKISNSLGNRSSDYRRIFFIYNKPKIGGKYYICSYCGRLLIKNKVTVDHLYPIGRASKSIKYQKKLNKRGLKNINDPSNLVAACRRCNQRKSDKAGLWILRGRVGQYKYIWYLRYIINLLLIIAIIYLLFKYCNLEYYIRYLFGVIGKFLENGA